MIDESGLWSITWSIAIICYTIYKLKNKDERIMERIIICKADIFIIGAPFFMGGMLLMLIMITLMGYKK